MGKKVSRTSIDILDQDLWNWAKLQTSPSNTTISDYIFSLIKIANGQDVERSAFLRRIELYYEFESIVTKGIYSFKQCGGKNWSEEVIFNIKRFLPNNYKFPLFGDYSERNSVETRQVIHAEMLKYGIMPNELRFFLLLSQTSTEVTSQLTICELAKLIVPPDMQDLVEAEIYTSLCNYIIKLQNEHNFDLQKLQLHALPQTSPLHQYNLLGFSRLKSEDIEDDLPWSLIKKSVLGLSNGNIIYIDKVALTPVQKEQVLDIYGVLLMQSVNLLVNRHIQYIREYCGQELGMKNVDDVLSTLKI